VGCSGQRRHYKHPVFLTESDVVSHLQTAMVSKLPDERREIVELIGRSRYRSHQVVLDVLATIARTDRSEAVRCAAIRALGKAKSPQAAPVLVEILKAKPSDKQLLPPTAALKKEALRAAEPLLEGQMLSTDPKRSFRDAAIGLLGKDPSRDVRQAAARLLGHIEDRAVLEPLIDSLDQRDFGVVYESERSLKRLTGQSFQHDAPDWRQWLRQNPQKNPLVNSAAATDGQNNS